MYFKVKRISQYLTIIELIQFVKIKTAHVWIEPGSFDVGSDHSVNCPIYHNFFEILHFKWTIKHHMKELKRSKKLRTVF